MRLPLFVALFALYALSFLVFRSQAASPRLAVAPAQVSGGGSMTVSDGGAEGGSYIAFNGASNQCTIYVSPSGSDANSGSERSSPLRSPSLAVGRSVPGSVVCFAPGTYTSSDTSRIPALDITGKNGTAEAPITFRALDPASMPVFTLGGLDRGGVIGAITVRDSSYIRLQYLEATNAMRGVDFNSARHSSLEGSHVHSVGQEAVHIGWGHDKAGPSSYIRVQQNRIHDSGKRTGVNTSQDLAYSVFGELVYVGYGSTAGDTTNNIIIEENELYNGTAEAVDMKSGTHAITIRRNYVHHVDAWCQAVFMVNTVNGVTIEHNAVHDITGTGTRDGELSSNCDGEANVVRIENGSGHRVRHNVFWSIGKRGILIKGGSVSEMNNNTIFNVGHKAIEVWGGEVSHQGNITSDGTYGSVLKASSDFVGPLNDTADAGTGPGSGFRLKSGSGGADIDTLYR